MKAKIKYLDGRRFKRSIIASARRFRERQEELNEINVFPVPDGDTGTNMVSTMHSIAKGAESCHDPSISEVSNAIAESALNGARGNSGVILAQFFQGLAEATRGKMRVSARAFAHAAMTAAERAKEAISNPVEGTIITVMKDWATHLSEVASRKHDFVEVLKDSLKAARASVEETPEKLETLKKAGVVDAGAQGFVHILEGIVEYIENGAINAVSAGLKMTDKIHHFHLKKVKKEIEYQYCTECVVEGEHIDKQALRDKLTTLGDSLIVVGNEKKVRLHIHTNQPHQVLSLAGHFGTLSRQKIDDMRQQHQDIIIAAKKKTIALVTDSTCDLPEEVLKEHNIRVVPVLLLVGQKSYLDRVDIKSKDFYSLMKNTKEPLSTSQPPPAHFKAVYESLLDEYENILSLHISQKLSGTINGALMAATSVGDGRVEVFNTKTTSVALGLIVLEAGRLIKQKRPLQEIVDRINIAIESTKVFLTVPSLKNLMRSGRLKKSKGLAAQILNIRPILTVDSEGKVVEVKKVFGRKKVLKETLSMALDFAGTVKNPIFNIGHVLASELAETYRWEILRVFPSARVMITDASPALGLHTGIGSAGIAVLGTE